MNSAIETIASVQRLRLRVVVSVAVMSVPSVSLGCDRSLTGGRKKERSAVELLGTEQHLGPVRLGLVGAHGRERVEEHPLREERPDLLGVGIGLLLDELDEPGE